MVTVFVQREILAILLEVFVAVKIVNQTMRVVTKLSAIGWKVQFLQFVLQIKLVVDLLEEVITTVIIIAAIQKGFHLLTAMAVCLQTRVIFTVVTVQRDLSFDLIEMVSTRLVQRVLFVGLIEFTVGRYLVK